MIVEALSDAELEAWVRVQNAVDLASPASLADVQTSLRHEPERRHLLALLDNEALGCAFVSRSSVEGRGFVLPRVVPAARRQGLGTLLLAECLDHVRRLGCRLVRSLDGSEQPPKPPAGMRLIALEPEHHDALRDLVREVIEDIPVVGGMGPGPIDFMLEELTDGIVAFVALEQGRVVGSAGLLSMNARPGALEHAFTTVARDRRGRGVAVALKQECVAWAAANGYRELVTWTQAGNEPMQAVNVRAGFRPGHVSLTVEAPVQ